MKTLRTIAFILFLSLLISVSEAETAGKQVLDFDDFTVECAVGTPVQKNAKTEGAVWLTFFPAFCVNNSTDININCIWRPGTWDIASIPDEDIQRMNDSVLEETRRSFQAMGIGVRDMVVHCCGKSVIGGRNAICLVKSFTLFRGTDPDGTNGFPVNLVQGQWNVSADRGTYVFTATTHTMEELIYGIVPIMESLRWKP